MNNVISLVEKEPERYIKVVKLTANELTFNYNPAYSTNINTYFNACQLYQQILLPLAPRGGEAEFI